MTEMVSKLFSTRPDITLTLLRLAVGVLFFAHGAQKTLGWFGGPGYSVMMGAFEHGGIPTPLAFLAIMAEFLGGIGLILGLLSRIAAFGILCNMLVAIFTVHLPNGLFMNWTGQQKGEGYEYHILVVAICIAIMVRGAGLFSIDGAIAGGAAKS
jgi:putative oxidoreductase